MEELTPNNRTEVVSKSEDEKDLSDSYFNGALVFKTKVVWWPNVVLFAILHAGFFWGWYRGICRGLYEDDWWTLTYALWIGYTIGEGVTLGAHRLWAHRSYKAVLPLRIILMLLQSAAGQNSLYIWVRDHRTHHKFSDTDGDPHNSSRGFFFSHMGWLLMKKHPDVIRKGKTVDLSDLEKDPVVMFQYRHMYWIHFVLGMILPTFVPYFFWNAPFWDAIFICYFARYVTLLNVTWCVNSVAHFYGNKPYDKNIRACENKIVSFFVNGEGWHNYHHIFPWDYKAGEFGWKINYSAVVIKLLEILGMAYDLRQATPEMIESKITKHGDSTFESRKKVKLSNQEYSKMAQECYDY